MVTLDIEVDERDVLDQMSTSEIIEYLMEHCLAEEINELLENRFSFAEFHHLNAKQALEKLEELIWLADGKIVNFGE